MLLMSRWHPVLQARLRWQKIGANNTGKAAKWLSGGAPTYCEKEDNVSSSKGRTEKDRLPGPFQGFKGGPVWRYVVSEPSIASFMKTVSAG